MVGETKEQLELEAEIKSQAKKFLTYLNSTLPESMELEYEGFYRRGFFVSKKKVCSNRRRRNYCKRSGIG